MKILFSDTTFSYLYPGGKQVHVEKLSFYLKQLGQDVVYENWHDPFINGHIVHFFGFNDIDKIKTLKKRGYKLVYTHIMDGLTNKSKLELLYHYIKNKFINFLPDKFNLMFTWRALHYFDAIVYMHENDRKTAIYLYNINPNKTYVISHAVDSIDSFSGNYTIDNNIKYLVSVGSIVERKNIIYTANLCIKNKIPIKFIGHPFDEESDYFKKFMKLTESNFVDYLGFLTENEKINVLKKSSGFVLLSKGESGCISVYEAAAARLPLLLSDLPWAKVYESPTHLFHCSLKDEVKASCQLNLFYKNSFRQETPTFLIKCWKMIATEYLLVYKNII
jgi:glycosyltransferase involved in cell wall biosynthesis